jgi:predicted transcriptional regulator
MSRTKLQEYVAIVKFLAEYGPSGVELMKSKAHFNCDKLVGNLEFLIKQGLIEETTRKNEVAYTATERGIRVLQFFGWFSSVPFFVQS